MDCPIIFSAPMVRALLDGRKTMTRRLAWKSYDPAISPDISFKPIPSDVVFLSGDSGPVRPSPWQRVQPGDRLWVREAHYVQSAGYKDGSGRLILYRATTPDAPTTWRPSIHMPRWASRLTLEVTATKIERLQEISEDDAIAEGMGIFPHSMSASKRFREVWNSLHNPRPWEANPEVVAISFNVHKRNIDE